MDLPKLMFIDEECGNLIDSSRTNNRNRMSEVLQAYRCPLCDKCYRRDWGKYGFSCGSIFCG